jgi:hypothetical protein
MTADDRLIPILAKIERAKNHIRDLDRERYAFVNSGPYKIEAETNVNRRETSYYLTKAGKVPLTFATATGDILHNLRSALDHLAYQLVIIGIGGIEPTWKVYFPVADSPAIYETTKMGKIKGMRQEAIDAIDRAKPYKGGDDTLWCLHRLNIIDKHRLVLLIGSGLQHVDITHRRYETGGESRFQEVLVQPVNRLPLVKEGDILWTDVATPDMPWPHVDYQLQFTFDIALGEPEVLKGKSLLETLQQTCDLVDNLISSFEPLLR